LVSNFQSSAAEKRGANGAAAAVKRRPDQGALPGVVGNVVGRLGAFVSSALQGSTDQAAKGAAGNGPRQRPGSSSNAAVQPKAGSTVGVKPTGPWWSSLTRRFALNGLLWALALTTVVASGMFYREHLRYADAQAADQAVIDVPVIKTGATKEVRGTPPADETPQAPAASASVASSVLGGLGLGGEAPAVPAPVSSAPGTNDAGTEVASLRTEVAALRELVERHDKMLRYVMDRYVEKSLVERGLAGNAAGNVAHEVTPESVSKSYDDPSGATVPPAVRAGAAHRKRREGGEALPMGDPDVEGAAAASPDVPAPKSNSGTGSVSMERRQSSGPMEDSGQNQLGPM
jgi:hypothetical protein